jgi:hypothetical protein
MVGLNMVLFVAAVLAETPAAVRLESRADCFVSTTIAVRDELLERLNVLWKTQRERMTRGLFEVQRVLYSPPQWS